MREFPSPAPLLPEILALHGKWRAQKDAVVLSERRVSWKEFVSDIHQHAHGFINSGLQTGDRIGVFMANGYPMLTTLFASVSAGTVSVPLNTSVSDDAIVSMLRDAEIKMLVVSETYLPRFSALIPMLPDDLVLVSDVARGGWLALSDLAKGQSTLLPETSLDGDSGLNIIYSSGTTGLPKGILHTHRGRRDWAYDLSIALRYNGGARTLLTLGLYSNISWVAMLCTLLAGGSLVLHERFDAEQALDSIEQDLITHTAMVPLQFQQLLAAQHRRPRQLESMQAMMSCGSPLFEGVKRSIFDTFGCGVIELYGLTEGIITTLDPEDAHARLASVGKPLLGTDILILDDNDVPCAPGEAGEILSRGRITMPGYWRRPDANEEARFDDGDGQVWLRSGDIGRLDSEGFLYIVDRKKDMIISGGQNIFPQDIEAVLMQDSRVSEVAVIGVPCEKWGETPIALVVFKEATNDSEALLEWANQRLGKQQRLRQCIEIDAIPRNPNGKILKRELRNTYGEINFA